MRTSSTFFNKHKEKILPLMIILLGIALRIYCFGDVPGGYHRDEAYGAWNALSLFKDGIDSAGYSYPVYFEAWAHGQNALNSYLMLPLILLSGGHIAPWVVRTPQLILSIATLIAIYSMMKTMFSHRVAVWALFLTAICPWHVMMSRWGLESNLAPGFLMLGLLFWIKGMQKPYFLLLSGLSYGLSLYCYATIWPIVPVMVLLQIIYSLATHKIKLDKWLILFCIILISLGLPLVLFLLINMELLPELKIGCFSIYKMTSFRSGELATSFTEILANLRNFLSLLIKQDVGRPYDVIMPYGFFYDIGRFFILIGVIVVCIKSIISIAKKTFSYEVFLLIQLIGAGIVACFVTVNMTQINCMYVPLVLCEAIGILFIGERIKKFFQYFVSHKRSLFIRQGILLFIVCVYLVNLTGFQIEYYTNYRELVSAHFQEGADTAVRYAQQHAKAQNCSVYVNAGLKYPNVLLATETGARDYLDTLIYSENLPAPAQFDCNEVTFFMGFDPENIKEDEIYVLYYTETEFFKDFTLTQFSDWYVAVPCN